MKKIDNKFIKALVILAIPIILQNLITASLNLLDNIMIGHLGVSEIASIGLANQYYLIFFMTVTGCAFGSGIFMSQFWGRRDIKSIKKYLGIAIISSVSFSILFALGAVIYPEYIIKIFTDDVRVITLGVGYLRYVSLSYIFTALSVTIQTCLRSTGQTSLPMKGSLIGLISNGVLNYIFIFGKLGVPAMGVSGAAIGTTFSRLFELTYLIYMIYSKDNIIKSTFKEMFGFSSFMLKSYIRKASPVIANDFLWILGMTFYSKAYALLGTEAIATMQIALIMNNLFLICGQGIAIAAAIMIGNNIGEGKAFLEIKKDAYNISIFTIVIGIVIGIAFFIVAPYVMLLFNVTQSVKEDVIFIIRTMSVVLPLRFFGVLQIIGTFRSGGDVLYAIYTEMMSLWVVGIPLAFFSALYLKVDIRIVYMFVCIEDVAKIFFIIPRLKSGKWIKVII
ncbi:MATE family efflux transporter [Fusobacterium sp. MFO224]|uniref:MATE family efflux transporter n=1 Tax=Fusobacterium sp. MFO224 TaxID=3378070 RepID=UPI003853D702